MRVAYRIFMIVVPLFAIVFSVARGDVVPLGEADFDDMVEGHAVAMVTFHAPGKAWDAFMPVLNRVGDDLRLNEDILVGSVDQFKESRLSASYADGQPLVIKCFFRGYLSYNVQYAGAATREAIAEYATKLEVESRGTIEAFNPLATRATRFVFMQEGAPTTIHDVKEEMAHLVDAMDTGPGGAADRLRAAYYLKVVDEIVKDSGTLANQYNEHRGKLSRGKLSGDQFVSTLAQYRVLEMFTSPLMDPLQAKRKAERKAKRKAEAGRRHRDKTAKAAASSAQSVSKPTM